MYRDIIKKNRYVRTLAFRYRNWRENRSFTSGSGHKIEKKGVCVNSIIQISGDNNSVLLDNDSVLYRSKIKIYCCPLKVSEQRDIHPQCCCNGIADDFSEGKPLS